MARRPAGSAGTSPLAELARAWVEASCADQGLPVKLTDPSVLARVATLLGLPESSGVPDGIKAGRIEPVQPASAGVDDQVVEDGGDDGALAA
jgi:hypothetical protein